MEKQEENNVDVNVKEIATVVGGCIIGTITANLIVGGMKKGREKICSWWTARKERKAEEKKAEASA